MTNGPYELAPKLFRGSVGVLEEHERGDDLSPRVVRPSDDAAFGDGRVGEEGAFDLDRPETVRRDLDHFVGPTAEPEVAILVDVGRVAGVVRVALGPAEAGLLFRPRAIRCGVRL